MAKREFGWVKQVDNGESRPRFSVLILGGGFSGTMLAFQLLRRDATPELAIVESREALGRGIACSATHDCHLLNVPARGISALADDSDHFLNWVRTNRNRNLQGGDFSREWFTGGI